MSEIYFVSEIAEIYFILETMGLDLNLYDDTEEIKQLLNKLGRPDLKNLVDNIINNKDSDSDYEYLSFTESESEEEDNDIVNENLEIHLSKDGFYKIK